MFPKFNVGSEFPFLSLAKSKHKQVKLPLSDNAKNKKSFTVDSAQLVKMYIASFLADDLMFSLTNCLSTFFNLELTLHELLEVFAIFQ